MLFSELQYTSIERAYVWRLDGTREYRYGRTASDIPELECWIDQEVARGDATGGDMEIWIKGLGWCMWTADKEN